MTGYEIASLFSLSDFLISFSQAVSTKALRQDSSVKEKKEGEGVGEKEEERRRRKAEDVDYQVVGNAQQAEVDYQVLGNANQAEVDYQVLTPHLNLQDIHAFTESGLKDNVFGKFELAAS